MEVTQFSKTLVLRTIIVLIAISGFVWLFNHSHLPSVVALHTKGQPTMGYSKAKVHLVVFEEPKCPQCQQFNNLILPQIKEKFIDTNQVLYTLIPVSFLSNSMAAAVAWLCVFNQEKDYPDKILFFKYVDYMYAHQPAESHDWATDENLIEFAKAASPAIKLDILKNCIDQETYRIQIEKNTNYGMQIMHGELATPTVYVNGIKVEEISDHSISQLIDECLAQKGVL